MAYVSSRICSRICPSAATSLVMFLGDCTAAGLDNRGSETDHGVQGFDVSVPLQNARHGTPGRGSGITSLRDNSTPAGNGTALRPMGCLNCQKSLDSANMTYELRAGIG